MHYEISRAWLVITESYSFIIPNKIPFSIWKFRTACHFVFFISIYFHSHFQKFPLKLQVTSCYRNEIHIRAKMFTETSSFSCFINTLKLGYNELGC